MDKLLDLTRDFDVAKAAFEVYLDEYDRADDKIHLKIVHTYGVVDAAEDIARRMGLGEEDVQLAKLIGLLHDIDFELYPEEHCIKSQEIMKERGIDEKIIHATASHGLSLIHISEPTRPY